MSLDRKPNSDAHNPNGRLHLSVPAHHGGVRIARARIRACGSAAGLFESELERLEFVAGELLTNAVDHGGGLGAMDAGQWNGELFVEVWLQCDGQGWRLEVDDQGGGDPAKLQKLVSGAQAMPDLDDERGRGFFLLLSMLDSLEVRGSQAGGGIALIAEVRDPGPN